MDVEELRDWIGANALRWLRETLAQYPEWAQQLVREQPMLVWRRLVADPQWLNEQVRLLAQSPQERLF